MAGLAGVRPRWTTKVPCQGFSCSRAAVHSCSTKGADARALCRFLASHPQVYSSRIAAVELDELLARPTGVRCGIRMVRPWGIRCSSSSPIPRRDPRSLRRAACGREFGGASPCQGLSCSRAAVQPCSTKDPDTAAGVRPTQRTLTHRIGKWTSSVVDAARTYMRGKFVSRRRKRAVPTVRKLRHAKNQVRGLVVPVR
jgi:hypothetical protein